MLAFPTMRLRMSSSTRSRLARSLNSTPTSTSGTLLKVAGARDGRLHDARHTEATVLMLLGTQERAAMDVLGWATPSMEPGTST